MSPVSSAIDIAQRALDHQTRRFASGLITENQYRELAATIIDNLVDQIYCIGAEEDAQA